MVKGRSDDGSMRNIRSGPKRARSGSRMIQAKKRFLRWAGREELIGDIHLKLRHQPVNSGCTPDSLDWRQMRASVKHIGREIVVERMTGEEQK